jgi:hypothetical protein
MWHDNETTLDLLGFERIALTICSLAKQVDLLPTTVGLFGDWGSGKSSILGMVEKQLKQEDDVICLRFDGWLFEGYDDAKAALMTDIITSINEKNPGKEGFINKATKLLKRVDWFRVAGLAKKGILSITSPLTALNFVADSAGEVKDLLKPEEREIFESIRQFRAEFESLIKEAGFSSVAILIDDLDRCLPDSIISTFEAIKLFLSVPGTIFVIAADERIVRHAISRRYPVDQYHEQDLPQDYLEKIIQIPIRIPPLTETDVSCYLYLLFAERTLKQSAGNPFETLCGAVKTNRKNRSLPEPLNWGIANSVLDNGATNLQNDFAIVQRISQPLCKGLDGNPRLIKRFLNTFSLRIAMAQAMGIVLAPDILAKLMVLERFHEERFKELYEWQLIQNGIPEQIERLENAAHQEDKSGDNLSDKEKVWLLEESVRNWLNTEPSLSKVPLSEYFSIANETLRISTKAGRHLPPALQTMLANLQSSSKAVRKSAIQGIMKTTKDDIEAVYLAVLGKALKDPAGDAFLGLTELADEHEDTLIKFLAECKKIDPASLKGTNVFAIATFKTKYPQHASTIDELLTSWAACDKKEVKMAAETSLKPPKTTKKQ